MLRVFGVFSSTTLGTKKLTQKKWRYFNSTMGCVDCIPYPLGFRVPIHAVPNPVNPQEPAGFWTAAPNNVWRDNARAPGADCERIIHGCEGRWNMGKQVECCEKLVVFGGWWLLNYLQHSPGCFFIISIWWNMINNDSSCLMVDSH